MDLFITAHGKLERHRSIESADEVRESILEYCQEHKIKSCKFRIEGEADIKVVVDTPSLGALFG